MVDISKVFLNVLKFDKKISNQILGSILTCYRNVYEIVISVIF